MFALLAYDVVHWDAAPTINIFHWRMQVGGEP